MPFQAPVVLLDKDDVLHDNISFFAQIMEIHYRTHNYKQHLTAHQTVVEDYYIHGSAVRMFCREAFPANPADAKHLEEQIFAQVHPAISNGITPQETLNNLLFNLQKQGCVFGVVTHNTPENTRRDLAAIGLASLFEPEFIVTEKDLGNARKTTPEGYRLISERLQSAGIVGREVYMVDDHPHNLRPVKGLGWNPVQVGNAPRVTEETWPCFTTLENFILDLNKKLSPPA